MRSTAPGQSTAALGKHGAAAGLARLLWGWLDAARRQRQRAEVPRSGSGQKNCGSCGEMGPRTPSSALPPTQCSGVWVSGVGTATVVASPPGGRIRKPSELTSGHPQKQQCRIVLRGSHRMTSQDRSIPNAAETPRIKALLEAASFCSQAQPARAGRLQDPGAHPTIRGQMGEVGAGWERGRGLLGDSPSPRAQAAPGSGRSAGGVPGNQRGGLGSIVSLLRLQRTMGHCCLWGSHCLLSLRIPAVPWMEVSRGPGRLRVWDTK